MIIIGLYNYRPCSCNEFVTVLSSIVHFIPYITRSTVSQLNISGIVCLTASDGLLVLYGFFDWKLSDQAQMKRALGPIRSRSVPVCNFTKVSNNPFYPLRLPLENAKLVSGCSDFHSVCGLTKD